MVMVILYCTNVSLGEDSCKRIMISVRGTRNQSLVGGPNTAGVPLFIYDLVLNYLQVNPDEFLFS